MRNPKEVFTKDGYLKFIAHLVNIREGIFYITNHGDDLGLYDELIPLYAADEQIQKIFNEKEFEDEDL